VKVEDVRDLTDVEVNEQIAQAKEELFRLRFRSATQQLENPMLVRQLRRDVSIGMKSILRRPPAK
jgi:large subunit ribosomal protein L29